MFKHINCVMQQQSAGKKNGPIKIIFLAGLIAGSLDILSAFIDHYIQSGKGPEGVLRFVASGTFGQDAFTGGDQMIVFGLLFHFIIAFCFTIFFYWLYQTVPFLQLNIFVTAILYGLFIWVVMNLIVVPLSNTNKYPFHAVNAVKSLLILICMIGLPLTLIVKYFSKK